jgi:hypothetical protein
MKKTSSSKRFAICVTDTEPDLVSRRVYQVLPDKSAARSDYLRVVDESGEDYLYPAHYFVRIRIPKAAQPRLASRA